MSSQSYFEQLKTLAAKVLRNLRGGLPPFSEDPLAGVREPRPRRPDGRTSAAAVDEPWEAAERADALGRVERPTR
jgi:hypothetical protein